MAGKTRSKAGFPAPPLSLSAERLAQQRGFFTCAQAARRPEAGFLPETRLLTHDPKMRRWGLTLLVVLLFLVAGCTRQAEPTPTPAATPLPVVSSSANGNAKASGKVVPISHAQLSFAAAGRVQTVPVKVGDLVPAGALLLALDDAAAKASAAQAQAALDGAQAHLKELQAGARPKRSQPPRRVWPPPRLTSRNSPKRPARRTSPRPAPTWLRPKPATMPCMANRMPRWSRPRGPMSSRRMPRWSGCCIRRRLARSPKPKPRCKAPRRSSIC